MDGVGGFDEPVTAGQRSGFEFREEVFSAFWKVGEETRTRREVCSWWKDGRGAWRSLCTSGLSWLRIIAPTSINSV